MRITGLWMIFLSLIFSCDENPSKPQPAASEVSSVASKPVASSRRVVEIADGKYVLVTSVSNDVSTIACRITKSDGGWLAKTHHIYNNNYAGTSNWTISIALNEKGSLSFDLPWDLQGEAGGSILTPPLCKPEDAEIIDHCLGIQCEPFPVFFSGDISREVKRSVGSIKTSAVTTGRWHLLRVDVN